MHTIPFDADHPSGGGEGNCEILSPMLEMSEQEYLCANDPPPGSDPSWDSLSESEKDCFRRPQSFNGKSLSDLLRDREALNMSEACKKVGSA